MSPKAARRSVRSRDADDALPVAFYDRPAEVVARELLGCRMVSICEGSRVVAEIVETEAYAGPDDEASHGHSRFGVTPRNSVMYGPPGHAYVYRIYGMHWCFNTVTGPEGYAAAILIRAARPVEGIETIRERRPDRPDRDLLRGPANLCRGLAIDRECNGRALTEPPVWLTAGDPVRDEDVQRGPRIGISRAIDAPLRFWVRGSEWVSGRVQR